MKLIPSLGVPAWASGFKLVTTVCDGCGRSVTTRHHSAHNLGIRMHEAWYCGASCFTAAAEGSLSHLSASSPDPATHAERMPLGLLLLSRGVLTREQLRSVTQEQRETGGEIGSLLTRRGILSERQVAAARATQWNCPLFAVPRNGVVCTVCLPPPLVRDYSAISLHHGAANNQLLVGFVHSIDYGLLYAIEHVVGCKAQGCFITPADFQVQRTTQGESHPVKMFEAIRAPEETAAILCQAALELEAHEAVIAKCRNYLWARLKRESLAQDLLFRTTPLASADSR